MRELMNFARLIWVIFLGTLTYGGMLGLLRYGASERAGNTPKKIWIYWGLSLGNAAVIMMICTREWQTLQPVGQNGLTGMGAESVLLSLLAGGLLAAACMDAESCYVYNYVWWWCLLWTGILWWIPAGKQSAAGELWQTADKDRIQQAAAVLVFIALQQCLFARMYGRADSHAFSVCALISCRWRAGMPGFLIHMLLAVILLAVVQLGRGNVTLSGKLRTPKPFVPYIIITFWAEILWMFFLRAG